MNAINKENSKVFLLILLGMLSAFGPFVTDMYLPSLPAMTDYFSTNSSMVQLGLTTSMIGLALGQVFFSTFRSFGVIVHNRRYMLYVFQLAFAQGILFAYIASSPFIVQQHYGFSPFAFSICFAVNAVSIGVAAAISVKFRRTENGTLTGCIGMVVLSILVLVALYGGCGFWVYELLMFALLFMMGLTFTASTTLAMDSERRYAGAASALLGALCFATGGIVSPLVGLGNILVSTGVTFVICAICSWLCALWAVRQPIAKMAVC